ncbi:MAG: hypothetical protein BIFFINMI_00189 [Phycisphaerae bacterium]|nr:hypothetical protein [Phycisphaerae bacterium]
MRTSAVALLCLILAASALADDGRIVNVADAGQLRAALASARPGDTIRLAPGHYGTLWSEKLAGTLKAPIIIESADPARPAEFGGGSGGIHMVSPAHVVLRGLRVRKCSDNGINIDDGGKRDGAAHDVRLEKVSVLDVGPKGNHDGIKLSGVEASQVVGCTVSGWGGSAIDMVGCHDMHITGCTFRGKEGFGQDDGVQMKGGSRHVYVLDCLFVEAGSRGVNVGGSTGIPFFRPPLEKMDKPYYEARDCLVENNRFIGGEAAVAFVTQEGCAARFNTIYRPRKFPFRILEETKDERFLKSRRGVIEHNVIVWRTGDMYTAVNVGPGTEAASFTFAANVWFCENRPAASRPDLPARETDGLAGVDPKLKDPAKEDLTIGNAEVLKAAGWRPAPPATTQPDEVEEKS